MPDLLPRRRVLLASATTLPLLLGAAGCRSSDLFAGPDPLAGRPRPSHDVVTLQAVIAAEEHLIRLYRTAVNGDPGAARALSPLLADHEQHLTRLRSRLIVPQGNTGGQGGTGGTGGRVTQGGTGGRVTQGGQGGTGGRVTPGGKAGSPGGPPPGINTLRAAERGSAADLVQRLATVSPALAQLFASIAACDSTHVAVLSRL